jgi:aconitase A
MRQGQLPQELEGLTANRKPRKETLDAWQAKAARSRRPNTWRQAEVEDPHPGPGPDLCDGSVVIAAITSCTNTSNPRVMSAGLVARNAGETRPQASRVKTSLGPGSLVVTDYLRSRRAGRSGKARLLRRRLRLHHCIGNSGPHARPRVQGHRRKRTGVALGAVGNRNFEGRVHPRSR